MQFGAGKREWKQVNMPDLSDGKAGAPKISAPVSLQLMLADATRQLNVCNSCRYCEGLCAVYPAIERRTLFELADLSQLGNLCHDCRACFDSCMYTAPHEFDINMPKLFAEIRLFDYQRFVWPYKPLKIFSGRLGIASAAAISALIVFIFAIVNVGFGGLITRNSGPQSPYILIPADQLDVLLLIPAIFTTVVLLLAGRKYWKEVGGAPTGLSTRVILTSIWYAITFRYMDGAGANCNYPDDEVPSPSRRRFHFLVSYGFGLCIVSTTAAAFLQHVQGIEPPYAWISVPVISGVLGGIGLIIGCWGLVKLKLHNSEVTSIAKMNIKDYGFLFALEFLALSGMATLLTRETLVFGLVFLIHLSTIILAFALAAYSKFVHFIFRFLSILRDNFERAEQLQ